MNKTKFSAIRSQLKLTHIHSETFVHFLKDAFLLASCAAIWTLLTPSPWRALCFPLVSTLMFRNFSLMHDAVHGAATKPRWLNDIIGLWSGCLCLLPFEAWKKVHLQHHHWAGNVDQDPVMMIVKSYPNWPQALQKLSSFLWKAWVPFMAGMQYLVFWLHSAKLALKGNASLRLRTSVLIPVLSWAGLLTFAPQGFVLSALIPGLVLYLLAVEVVNFPHHLELPQNHGDTRLAVWDQHQIARSCIYPKWFAENVVLNFNYHIEHHLYPNAPWYHLDKIHDLLKPELGSRYNSDPNFSWILKNRPKDLIDVMRALEAEHGTQTPIKRDAA